MARTVAPVTLDRYDCGDGTRGETSAPSPAGGRSGASGVRIGRSAVDDVMTGTIDGTTAGGVPWQQVPRVARGTITAGTRTVVLAPGHPVSFGRSPSARLRIGHGPVCDEVVPDLAGEVFVHDGRVVVANLHDTLALDIRIPRRPLLSVPPGDWHAPVDRAYAVLVTGTFTYELAVTVGTGGGARRGDRGCTGDGGQRR